jgi:hypothetical protein
MEPELKGVFNLLGGTITTLPVVIPWLPICPESFDFMSEDVLIYRSEYILPSTGL